MRPILALSSHPILLAEPVKGEYIDTSNVVISAGTVLCDDQGGSADVTLLL